MSRRKKSPGFNPRKHAREQLVARMNSVIGVYDGVKDEISKFSARVKHEDEAIRKLQDDSLRQFSLEVLSNTSAGLIGLAAEVDQKGTALLSAIDSAAQVVLKLLDSHLRWDEIKDDAILAELPIDKAEVDYNEFLREAQLTLLELYHYYADRIEYVRDFMKAGGTLEEAKANIAKAEADAGLNKAVETPAAEEKEEVVANA